MKAPILRKLVALHAKHMRNHTLCASSTVIVDDDVGPGQFDAGVDSASEHADDDDAGDVNGGNDRWRGRFWRRV